MAGVKGRSGGVREGAGRPQKSHIPQPPPVHCEPGLELTTDAKEFLEGVLSGKVVASPDQIKAAQALLPFQHQKIGETGKKAQRKEEADKVAGKFAPQPPRLVAVSGKTV